MYKLLLTAMALVGTVNAQLPARIVEAPGQTAVVFGAIGTNGKRFDSGNVAMTSSATVVTAIATAVQSIHCNTINSTATTVTVTDGNGVVYADAVAIAAGGIFYDQFGAVGMTFAAGVKITAGANSALRCQVVGVQ